MLLTAAVILQLRTFQKWPCKADTYILTNCFGVITNLAPYFHHIHPYVCLHSRIESPLSAVTSHRQPGARTHVGWYCTAYSRMVALHRAHCATAEREAAIDLTKPIGRFIKSADRIKSAERSLERHCRELSIL